MKLKKLYIRNIASIEKADIDFENGLNNAVTNEPSSIFLISGDTGAGKSVILDSISLALYKKTPRISSVANVQSNNFTNGLGEQLPVASVKLYTRMGISPGDDCYSEVEFEGNDGRTYHARLTLGLYLGNTVKATGKRPIKHKRPKWEIRIDNGDWTTDNVEGTILDAVGIDFQQFGRMAMLAQGQFANFLTGNKKEREAILEQLTNTQHFSSYGEAIKSLWNKAKDNLNQIKARYETQKPHTLSDDEVEQLKKDEQEDDKQIKNLNEEMSKQEAMIKAVDLVLNNEETQQEASKKKKELEAVVSSEEYNRRKNLFTDWDSTTQQRGQLTDLQRAKQDEKKAQEGLQKVNETFKALSADILYRQAQTNAIESAINQTQAWIAERQQHEELFDKAGEVDLRIHQYLDRKRKADGLVENLKYEQGKTDGLEKAKSEAEANVQKAKTAVEDKQKEIDELNERRAALNPDAIDKEEREKNSACHNLDIMGKACDDLELQRNDADALKKKLDDEKVRLEKLKKESDQAENDYKATKEDWEKADKLLNTMQMSINETLVNLRRRLKDEQADTCPLCGQHITADHLKEDFQDVLTPLEQEQQKAKEAYDEASKRYNSARDVYKTSSGSFNNKQKQLDEAQEKIGKAKETLDNQARKAGLDIDEPLKPQIQKQMLTLEKEIDKLQEAKQQAEALQKAINKLLKEKRPLDTNKSKADIALSNAKNAFNSNAETIVRVKNEHKTLTEECERDETDIGAQLAGYCDDWQADTDALRSKLKKDAKEFGEHRNQLKEARIKFDRETTLNNSLAQIRQTTLYLCPDWDVEVAAKAHPCRDITNEWNELSGQVRTLVTKITDSRTKIVDCTTALEAYYQESGKTEQQLVSLIAQEKDVADARKFVGDIDSELKSRNDAIKDAKTKIDDMLQKLGVGRADLPDSQQLKEKKNATMKQRDELVTRLSETKVRLKAHNDNVESLKEIELELVGARKRFERWDKLNSIFGGDRFRTLVQTYILRPLLNNANIYLERITDRYSLTCSEENEQLSILVLDRYNKNQVRSATVLSGGERFMVSLALSLALSSLNRSDMNVNILFIDEGFGTLDEKSLDSVMSTLEKLQEIAGQTNRRVGIISHREELEERIPVKIKVINKGEGRSMIEVSNSIL